MVAEPNLLQAALLGLIEGLTEFIPVSSTGHLILLIDLLGFQGPPGKVFEIVIQLGAILAVCWLYRAKLFGALFAAHKDNQKRWFLLNIIIAFIPSAILGATLHGFIKSVLFDPLVVASVLVIGGVIMIIIEKFKPEPTYQEVEAFTPMLALKIGLCQTLAMIPGTSRSGATIMGAMLLKVRREAATEFSFFLAIPTMMGATAYDLYKNYAVLSGEGIELIMVGFIVAFLAALLVVKTVINFISKHGFVPFAYYRIIVGSCMLWLLL